MAYLLLKGCGVGRDSAVGSMGAKSLSLVMVTTGLIVASLDGDGGGAAAFSNSAVLMPTASTPAAPALGLPPFATIVSNASAQSAAFYASYPQFAPMIHSLRGYNAYGRPWRHPKSRRSRKAAKARKEYFWPTKEEQEGAQHGMG